MTRPFLTAISILFLVLGCASTKPLDPIAVQPVKPEKGQVLAVDDVWVVVDTSGSLEQSSGFPQTKQVVEAFVGALPDDEYDVGLIVFGGDEVIELPRLATGLAAAPSAPSSSPMSTTVSSGASAASSPMSMTEGGWSSAFSK